MNGISGWALFIADSALLMAAAWLLTASLRLPTRPARLAALWIMAFALIVLPAEILSLFRLLSGAPLMAFHGLATLGGGAIWLRSGRPALLNIPQQGSPAVSPARWWGNLDLIVLSCFMGAAYLICAALILTVAPNNPDSLHYHLARAAYWMRHDSLAPWPTFYIFQVIHPPNAELAAWWTMEFLKTDQLTGFVQWSAAAVGATLILALARLLGASRAQALFAMLMWCSFPLVLFQSTTAQNDMVAGVLLLAAVYFLFSGFSYRSKASLLVSGVALGLAVGTKITALLALPGLGLASLLLPRAKDKASWRLWLRWCVCCAVGTLLLGSYIYVQNSMYYKWPLGPRETIEYHSGDLSVEHLKSNLVHYAVQMADPIGLPTQWEKRAQKAREGIARRVFAALGENSDSAGELNQELISTDYAWFGPLGCILLPLGAIIGLFHGIMKRDRFCLALSLILAGYVIFFSAAIPWQAGGRQLLAAAALCAPFVAFLHRRGAAGALSRWAITLAAVGIAGVSMAVNAEKPLRGNEFIYAKNRDQQRTVLNPVMYGVKHLVEMHVPETATVGLILGFDDWEYYFFGEKFTRTLIPLAPAPQALDTNALRARGIEYVVIRNLWGDQKFKVIGKAEVLDTRMDIWDRTWIILRL